jgi:DNA polymerase-3 subunit alpha
MPAPSFVHLRLHSEYSIVDGIVRLDEAVEAAAADGMPALGLTDLGNVFGMVKFYQEARARGVKPVLGCDVWLENEPDRDKPHRLLLLAQSRAGYLRLSDLLTRAYRGNRYRGRAELKRGWFAEAGTDGLIALSGAHHGDLGQALVADNQKLAQRLAREWQKLFPGRYYVELQRPGRNATVLGEGSMPVETYVQRALKLASFLKLPVVATHPVQFVRPDDFRAHEARVCIAEGYRLSDPRRPRRFGPEQHFRTQAEMAEAFKDVPQALVNSVEIAKRCNLALELGKSQLPRFPTPGNVGLDRYLRECAAAGLEARMKQLYPDAKLRAERFARYRERLDFELNTIVQMGFPGYFLIVADFINWAKSNGIPVGPGRGSGAGSLAAYSLGITDLDPLRYDLLFERFLNPERVSMPDFDIDFCQDGRDRVIEYVKGKFGADSVSQIATFGTMAARAVVRDVGRVLDLSYTFCDQLAKLIPFQPGRHITLDEARKMEPQLKERAEKEEEVRELLALAQKLEGLTRNVGMHAGGVLIAPGKLTDFCPLYTADGSESVISQFDMKDVEAVGLVKFDFLGLTTLTILDWTLRYIRNEDRGMWIEGKPPVNTQSSIPDPQSLSLESLPLDDPATYRLFAAGDTTGVFQFESRGMRDLLKRARPDRFEDLIALVSLYRPGPMELIPEFVRRKHGERVHYPDPRVEPILKPTYGIMVYQEQVMQIAQVIGGYSLGAADLLRRAMGKKLPEEMAQHRSVFVAGAARNGVGERKAQELFDLMEKFAGYGFNKCVVGSTEVQDARTGARRTVRELFEQRNQLDLAVHSLGDDWRLRACAVRGVVWNGRRPTFELRTALGRRIVATDNHPLCTLDGWTPLRDLAPGDRIATPRRLDVASTVRWPEHELIVLGGLLSEGSTCHPTCLYYFNNDSTLIADFTRAASCFPNTVGRVATRANGCSEVCLSTGRDTRFRRGQRPWNATEGNAALAQDEQPVRSGAFLWAQQLDLLNCRADRKRVPGSVFTLADENIALLLGRMWSGDGFIIGLSDTVPYYATSSEGLARDVQDLLLRLGVVARIQKKQFKYRGGLRPGYAVYLIGEDSVRRFVERVVPHCVGRDAPIQALKARLGVVQGGVSSKDTVPAAVRLRANAARIKTGLTWRELEVQSGVSAREFYGRGSVGKRGFRRATVGRLAAYFNDDRLRDLARSDVYWDTVVEIVPRGVEDVYDLEVEDDHNFVANGLIVHNSHAAAYALVAYQTAYFKAHHAAAFIAANMSAVMDDTDKVQLFAEDARAHGIELLAPDVNQSNYRFEPVDAKTVRYGLGAIKGTGAAAIASIVEARGAGPFRDVFDFCHRVDKRLVNRRVVESLVRAGAFDGTDDHRAALLVSVGAALESAEQASRAAQQVSLFGELAGSNARPPLADVPRWSAKERLQNEKLALGYYFSGHLFEIYREEVRRFVRTRLADLANGGADYSGRSCWVAGVVLGVRIQNTASGRMGVVHLADDTGRYEVVVFREAFEKHRHKLKEDELLVLEVRLRSARMRAGNGEAEAGADYGVRIEAVNVLDLGEARNRFARAVRLVCNGGSPSGRLRELLAPYRSGQCPVSVVYSNRGATCEIDLGEAWRVNLHDELIRSLREWLSPENVTIVYNESVSRES